MGSCGDEPTGAISVTSPPQVSRADDDRRTEPADRDPSPTAASTRKQLDEVFGDVLPTVTRDELDDEPGRAGGDDRDRWYRDNRPPHHG